MNISILSNMTISEICSVTTLFSEKNAHAKKQNRPYWAIVIKYEGETVYHYKNNSCISNIHNMVILPKGSSYEWICTKAGRYSIIEFQSELTHDEILCFPVNNGEKMRNIFHELEYKRILKPPTYQLECMRNVYGIILQLYNSSPKAYFPPKKQDQIRPAIDYIAKNYDKNIKNDELAALTGLSTVYFRKLFTSHFGISPIAYIHTLRINKAKEMLKSDYSSITNIAQSLGYQNVYDFSRDFKKHTGLSPRHYASL